MTPLQCVAVAAAGVLAGAMNSAVGSGSLVSFPVLLAVGYPPVVANVSNSLGLVPGSVSGAIGYRAELVGQRGRLLRFGAVTVVGALVGAALLIVLPPGAFEAIVPVLIVLALVLVVGQPWLSRLVAARQGEHHEHGGPALLVGLFAVGIYGGYFGASQGVLMVGLMGILMDEGLQRLNGMKNVLVAIANLVSGLVFVVVADVAWLVVVLLAVGSMLGGVVGAKVGRRLPATWLRGAIVVVGIVAIVKLVTA